MNTILHTWISLDKVTNFSLNWHFFFFFGPNLLRSITKKTNKKHHLILHTCIGLGTKFQLKLTFFVFWTKYAQKGYFMLKMENVSITTELCIFEFVLVPIFSLKWQFWFFGPNLPNKGISSLKQKNHTFPCVHGQYIIYIDHESTDSMVF